MTTSGVGGVILAGGQSRRFQGREKAWLDLGGKPLIERVVDRVRGQVSPLLLNVNGDTARFDAMGLAIATDAIDGHLGPLAGVLTGMEWMAAHAPDVTWLATFPVDTPFLPGDLVATLLAAANEADAALACAASDGRRHPVVGLWHIDLAGDLRRALVDEGIRRVDQWTARYPLATVLFSLPQGDPFFNINTAADLDRAHDLLNTVGL